MTGSAKVEAAVRVTESGNLTDIACEGTGKRGTQPGWFAGLLVTRIDNVLLRGRHSRGGTDE